MEIVLQRIQGYKDFSLGVLHCDKKLVTFTLEDEKRTDKVKGETRIPAGRYKIELRTVGGMNETYKKKFTWHRGMLWLRNVLNFEYIYIHIGNNDNHTDGCILVGNTCNVDKNLITSSTLAYENLCKNFIYPALDRKEDVWITIKDEN